MNRRPWALAGVNVTSVSCGRRHTAAVSDLGEVYAFGSNEFGELGVDPPPPRDLNKAYPFLTLRGWRQFHFPPPPSPPPSPPSPPPNPSPPPPVNNTNATNATAGSLAFLFRLWHRPTPPAPHGHRG
jgi:hypothetical protein